MKHSFFSTNTGMRQKPFFSIFFKQRGKEVRPDSGRLIATAVFLCCLMWASLAAAGGGRAYFSSLVGYRTGDFGTDTNYRFYYLTPAVGYVTETYEAGLSTALLSLQSKGTRGDATETGLGDVLIHGSRKFISEKTAGFTLSGGLAVKLPTADKKKGLGTGEPDFGGFLLLKKAFGSIALSALGGYIINGDMAVQTINDVPVLALGVSKTFSKSEIAVFYQNSGAYVSGADTARDIYLSGFHTINTDYAVQGALSFGLSDGSADFGVSIGFVRWF